MGDTTAETKALIEEARASSTMGSSQLIGIGTLLADLADALEASEADSQRLRQELAIKQHSGCDERWRAERDAARADHEALLAKVKALADEWERDSRDPAFRDTTRALSDHHAWRLRLAVQVDQEEHNDE
jgi:Ni/Co efflux regulator RcnB